MKTLQLAFGLALGAAAIGSLGGCASTAAVRVHPWERAVLADDSMNPNRDPLASSLSGHVYFSREASSGGRSVGGAGCGAAIERAGPSPALAPRRTGSGCRSVDARPHAPVFDEVRGRNPLRCFPT